MRYCKRIHDAFGQYLNELQLIWAPSNKGKLPWTIERQGVKLVKCRKKITLSDRVIYKFTIAMLIISKVCIKPLWLEVSDSQA